jgi:hypothetical protein
VNKARAMLEITVIGLAVSGAFGFLFQRLPLEAWHDGNTSPPLAPIDTEEPNPGHRNSRTDRV